MNCDYEVVLNEELSQNAGVVKCKRRYADGAVELLFELPNTAPFEQREGYAVYLHWFVNIDGRWHAPTQAAIVETNDARHIEVVGATRTPFELVETDGRKLNVTEVKINACEAAKIEAFRFVIYSKENEEEKYYHKKDLTDFDVSLISLQDMLASKGLDAGLEYLTSMTFHRNAAVFYRLIIGDVALIYIFTHGLLDAVHWGLSAPNSDEWIVLPETIDNQVMNERDRELVDVPTKVAPNARNTKLRAACCPQMRRAIAPIPMMDLPEPVMNFKAVFRHESSWIKSDIGTDITVENAIVVDIATRDTLAKLQAERLLREEAEKAKQEELKKKYYETVETFRTRMTIDPEKKFKIDNKLAEPVLMNKEVYQLNNGVVEICLWANDIHNEVSVNGEIKITACLKDECVLHWGFKASKHLRSKALADWHVPVDDALTKLCTEASANAYEMKFSCPVAGEPVYEISLPIEMTLKEDDEGNMAAHPTRVRMKNKDGVRSDLYPSQLCFVLRHGDEWFSQMNGGDMCLDLNCFCGRILVNSSEVAQILYNLESKDSFSLMHRMNEIHYALSKITGPGNRINESTHDDCIWILIWARTSNMRLLPWQKCYNTKPKDLHWSIHSLTMKLCEIWAANRDSPYCMLPRLVLNDLPRGGGNGQAIRDEILRIMHKHKITEENHHFYEQWHQKLHNNTTPDDIAICESVIRYLETGDHNAFIGHLKYRGLTLEDLKKYERPIVELPYMHGDTMELKRDFQAYLGTLKAVHGGDDVAYKVDFASSVMRDESVENCWKVVNMYQAVGSTYDVCMAIAEARVSLSRDIENNLNNTGALRDLLRLDASLEQLQSIAVCNTCTDIQRGMLSADEKLKLLIYIAKSVLESQLDKVDGDEMGVILQDTINIACRTCLQDSNPAFRDDRERKLMVLAFIDRASIWISTLGQRFIASMIPKITFFNEYILEREYDANSFCEEYVRNTFLGCLGELFYRAQLVARETADLGKWSLVSRTPNTPLYCQVVYTPVLDNIVDIFTKCTLVLCDYLLGSEDIPPNVKAIVVLDGTRAPNVLSHCAVRARHEKVLLTALFDTDHETTNELMRFRDKCCKIDITNDGGIRIEECSPELCEVTDEAEHVDSLPSEYLKVDYAKSCVTTMLETRDENIDTSPVTLSNVLEAKKFTSNSVGNKSLNLQILKSKQTESFLVPDGFALPHWVMNRCLSKARLNALIDEEFNTVEDFLKACCQRIMTLEFEDDIVSDVSTQMARLKWKFEKDTLLRAIKECWCSVFSMRPYGAISKSDAMRFSDIRMSVLVQQVYQAELSFVLHTNDITSSDDVIVGEMALGLGEAIVSNDVGSTLSWKFNRETQNYTIKSFPSKPNAYVNRPETYICRSDSNAEDRDDFPGAGLFESIYTAVPTIRRIAYSDCLGALSNAILFNAETRTRVIEDVSNCGLEIEEAFGKSMDIEGCIIPTSDSSTGYRICIVQARGQ